jgi:hypothetical protein
VSPCDKSRNCSRSSRRRSATRQTPTDVARFRGPTWHRPSSGRPCTSEVRENARGVCVARWYDPGTGQFMSVDPDLADTDQPYAYAGDDPVNEGDPLGDASTGPTNKQSGLKAEGIMDDIVDQAVEDGGIEGDLGSQVYVRYEVLDEDGVGTGVFKTSIVDNLLVVQGKYVMVNVKASTTAGFTQNESELAWNIYNKGSATFYGTVAQQNGIAGRSIYDPPPTGSFRVGGQPAEIKVVIDPNGTVEGQYGGVVHQLEQAPFLAIGPDGEEPSTGEGEGEGPPEEPPPREDPGLVLVEGSGCSG